jgi:hypothetical protein
MEGAYDDLITSVNGNPGSSLDDLYDQLYAYDMRNDEPKYSGSFSSSANIARCDTRPRGLNVAARTTEEVEVVVEEVATAVIAEIMIAALTATGAEMMTAVKGTGTVMITGVTAVMIGVTVVPMVVVVVGTLARDALTKIVPLPHMLIQIARYARYMAILQVTAGGVTLMTKMMMVIVMRRVHTLISMASTPTGTPIWGPPTTSLLS